MGIPRTVSWASARFLQAYSLKCPVSEGIRAAGSWLFISALPRQRILTGRYHYGRERAKICQYIHLMMSCVDMFWEVAPARGIPFRECPPVSLSIHYAN